MFQILAMPVSTADTVQMRPFTLAVTAGQSSDVSNATELVIVVIARALFRLM